MVEHHHSLDRSYGALASGIRREVLRALAGGEARVTDLAAPFEVSLAAVSKHIRVLEDAGLVERRIDGRDHWLRAVPDAMAPAADWLDTYRAFWQDRLDALESHLAGS